MRCGIYSTFVEIVTHLLVIPLKFIHYFHLPRTAPIIDIGGGDSTLADHLLAEGFKDLTVIDISFRSIEKAKMRLRNQAGKINWLISDVTSFRPERTYQLWHDRATFHFLITEKQISKYLKAAYLSTDPQGYLIMGTFSTNGPDKCSGLEV